MLYACLIKKLVITSFRSIVWKSPVRYFSIKTEAAIFLSLYVLKHNTILSLFQTWWLLGVFKITVEFQSFGGFTYKFKVMIWFTVERAVKQSWEKLSFENVNSLKELSSSSRGWIRTLWSSENMELWELGSKYCNWEKCLNFISGSN